MLVTLRGLRVKRIFNDFNSQTVYLTYLVTYKQYTKIRVIY